MIGFAIADQVGVRQLSDAFSTHDAADGHVQSWSERASDGAFGAIGLAGVTAGVGRAAIAAANKVDDFGRCMNLLTRLNTGLCFTGDTLVQVTALAGAPSTDPESAAAVATATLQTVAIAMLPLGSRVLADNPRPEEFDDTWPEPVQAEWVTLGLAIVKADGTPVVAEFLRPREWVERLGLTPGGALPLAVAELEIRGDALVTGISPCPPIAEGEGRVVTGRFVTRLAGNVVLVSLANGTEIRATDVHPVWSVDREEWVAAGELEPGERVDTLAGPVAVDSVQRLELPRDVYNVEVHGEHVFRVTADGVLVHNACNPARDAAIARYGEAAMKGWQAAHIIPRNGWAWADEALGKIIDRVTSLKLIDDIDVNIFYSNAGHMGTHTKEYVDDVIDVMKGRFSRPEMIDGINLLWKRIKAGEYLE